MREFFTPAPVAGLRRGVLDGVSWPRLGAATALSCLLHGLLFLLPYLGASELLSGLSGRGAPAQEAEQVVSVRLSPLEGGVSEATGRPGQSAPSEAPSALTADAMEPSSRRARGAETLPLPAPAFYSVDQLSLRPRALDAPNLYVPGELARALKGSVTLRLWISELGAVESAEVLRRTVPESVAEIALAAFRRVPYAPGEINGRPVGTIVDVDISYDDMRRTIR